MKGVSFGLGVFLFVNSFAALADDSNQSRYATAFGIGAGGGLSIKKLLSDTDQVFVGFGLSQSGNQGQATISGTSSSYDSNGRGYALFAGARHFLEKEKLSKFIQFSLSGSHSTSGGSGGSSSTSNAVSIMPGYGIEYFIAPDLSVEGVMGLSYTYSKVNIESSPTSHTTSSGYSFYFPVVGMAITYYW
jgi:hypothetical protein